MEHIIAIWSKNKKTGKSFLIETRIKFSQEQIEEFAFKKYIDERTSVDYNREYWAELEETKHI